MADDGGPPPPVFTGPKNAAPPFDAISLVNVDRVYQRPSDIALEVTFELVNHLKFAKFSPEVVAASDPNKVCQTLRVLQMLFDAGESDIAWYTQKLHESHSDSTGRRRREEEFQVLQRLNEDLEMRVKERSDRVAELEAEAASKKEVQREVDSLRQKFIHAQSELEKQREQAEEYKRSVEKKLKKAGEAEARMRQDTREGERDVRVLQQVLQQQEEDLKNTLQHSRAAARTEQSLRSELQELEKKEKGLLSLVEDLRAENEDLKITLEEKDDQCLSLERRAVDDLQAIRDKTSQQHHEKDKAMDRLKQEIAHMAEAAAMHKEEGYQLRARLVEVQQQTEEMAEKTAVKTKECKQLRILLEKERNRHHAVDTSASIMQGSSPVLWPKGIGGDREEFLQVSEALKMTKRQLTLEQARAKDDQAERERLERDVTELRRQLDVYEGSGPGAAVRDMRGSLAEMQDRLSDRDAALSELRDKLNQADDDLDNLLEFTEALKQLAISLGVTREQLVELSVKADVRERRATDVEELREKLYLRDKEIELLERERLHWKKQVRLQSLPRIEQAQRMGLTLQQISLLSEITDRMRDSGLSDVQALVGVGADAEFGDITHHAELKARLEAANQRYEALTETHKKLRELYIEVCSLRDENERKKQERFPTAIEDYLRGLEDTRGTWTGQPSATTQSEPSDRHDSPAHSPRQDAGRPGGGGNGRDPKTPATPHDKRPLRSPPTPGIPHILQQLAAPHLSDERFGKLAADFAKNSEAINDLRKELHRTNDSLEAAENRAKVYMQERDAFRRTLAARQRPAPTHTQPQPDAPAGGDPAEDGTQRDETGEVWETAGAALAPGAAQTEVEAALADELNKKEAALATLLEAFEAREKDHAVLAEEKASVQQQIDSLGAELQSKQDEHMRAATELQLLRESLADSEILLKEERARLEEHQEFIASLAGARDGEAVLRGTNEVLHKVTTLRVNEIRLVHRYKMAKAEADSCRSRLRMLELSHEGLQKESGEERAHLLGQLREAEGVQKVLHERLEFAEKTWRHDALRTELSACNQQLQAALANERAAADERHDGRSLKRRLRALEADLQAATVESEQQKARADRTAAIAKDQGPPGDASSLRGKIVELDVEVRAAQQRSDLDRQRAEAALQAQGGLEDEVDRMKAEVISLRKGKADLLEQIKDANRSLQETVPVADARALQTKLQEAESAKAKAEAKALRAVELSQASVEHNLTVALIHDQYKEDIDMLRRVIDGLDPSSEGYILGEMQFRAFQQTIETLALRKDKDKAELVVVSRKAQCQALRLQNTQLLSELAKVYDEYITKSHELVQENSSLKAGLDGRLSYEESKKLAKDVEDERAKTAEHWMGKREAEQKVKEMEAIAAECAQVKGVLALLDERNMTKVEAQLKRSTQELSEAKLTVLKVEWTGEKLTDEVATLQKRNTLAEGKIERLQEDSVRAVQQRDLANSEFATKVEELYRQLKDSKKREAAVAASTRREASTARAEALLERPGDRQLDGAGDSIDEFVVKLKESRQVEARLQKEKREVERKLAELTADLNDARADAQKKGTVNEALHKELLNERLKARQAVERVREAETSRGEALSKVARANAHTMHELLRKKDEAISRVNDQLESERRRFAAEKQIDNVRISELHKQLHKENAETIKQFSEKLQSISLAPPLRPDDDLPIPGSLMDVRMAQLQAELSRQQSKLDLAESEIAKLSSALSEADSKAAQQRAQAEKLAEELATNRAVAAAAAGGERVTPGAVPSDVAPLHPGGGHAVEGKLAAEVSRLERELAAEKAKRKAESEREKEEEVRRSAESHDMKTEGAGTTPKAGSSQIVRGSRVLALRDIVFKSGKRVLAGEPGIVRQVSEAREESTAGSRTDIVEVVFDSGLVFDATAGKDVEVAPRPAFTVHRDTPVDTVNRIILERETLIRQQALQIDALERDARKLSKTVSNQVDDYSRVERLRQEAEARCDELRTQLAASAPVRETEERLAAAREEVKRLERENKAHVDDNEALRGSVKSLKQEVISLDKLATQHERWKKADEELEKKFHELQDESEKNTMSLQVRMQAMKRDLERVLDREGTLRSEAERLEKELDAEKKTSELTAKELAKAAAETARRRNVGGEGETFRDNQRLRQAAHEAWTDAVTTAGSPFASPSPPRRDASLQDRQASAVAAVEGQALHTRIERMARQIEELELKNGVLRQHRFASAPSKEVEQLLVEKAEWSAVKLALLRQLREVQSETEAKERSIKQQLASCRLATEQQLRALRQEAEAATRSRDVQVSAMKRQLAEAEQDSDEAASLRRQLETANASIENLKAELVKGDKMTQFWKQKHASTRDEALRKEARRTKAPRRASGSVGPPADDNNTGGRAALRDVGINTSAADDHGAVKPARTQTRMSVRSPGDDEGRPQRAPSPGPANQELLKYWEENKRLKKQLAQVRQKQRHLGEMVPQAEFNKAKSEASQLKEELHYTLDKLREKNDELHKRAVDMHTFEKVKSFKTEIMKLEDENSKLKRASEVDREIDIRRLTQQVKRKDEQVQALEARLQDLIKKNDLSGIVVVQGSAAEHVATEPQTLINELICDHPSLTDKLEQLRGLLKDVEDRLLDANNEALQLRFGKELAASQQQRAERHLKDLMAIAPQNLVDDDGGAMMSSARPRFGRDRQVHDLQQVVEGLKQVVQKLQSDNEALKRNGVSNQKYVDLLKEHKALKEKHLLLAPKPADPAPPPPPGTQPLQQQPAATLRKKLKHEQEASEELRREVARLKDELGARPERPLDAGASTVVADARVALLSVKLQETTVRAAEVEKKLNVAEVAKAVLQSEVAGLQEKQATLETERDALEARCRKLDADLALFDADFLEEVANMQRQNESLLKANKHLEQKVLLRSALQRGGGDDSPTARSQPSAGRPGRHRLSLRESVDLDTTSSFDNSRIDSVLQNLALPMPHGPIDSVTSASTATLDLSNYPRR